MVLIRRGWYPALLLAVASFIGPVAGQAKASRKSLSKLFRYSVDPDAPGGCSEYGLDALNAMADDAYTLTKEGLQAVQDSQDTSADTYAEANRLLAAMFINPSSNKIKAAKSK